MYKRMYYLLFNAVTDALRLLEKGEISLAQRHHRHAQQQAEELFITAEDTRS